MAGNRKKRQGRWEGKGQQLPKRQTIDRSNFESEIDELSRILGGSTIRGFGWAEGWFIVLSCISLLGSCFLLWHPWTADYLKITGDLDVDLHSNIAAEARAKIVYERLINFCDDPGTKEALQFLMTREITHMRAFMQALDSLGKGPLSIGIIPPTPDIVDQYYSDSTGKGDQDEVDTTGPWNTQEGISVVEAPALSDFQVLKATPKAGRTTLNNGRARVTPGKTKR